MATYRAVLAAAMQSATQVGATFEAPDDRAAESGLAAVLQANWQEPGAVVRLERAGQDGWEATGVEVHVDE